MFGCSLPACAVAYSCIGELVQDGVNGLLFTTPEELAAHWVHLLHGFPDSRELQRLQEGTSAGPISCWEDAWADIVKPIVTSIGLVESC